MDIRTFIEQFRENRDEVMREPEYLTSLPAPADGDYPLRTKQEDQLYRALCQRGRHILLHGPGGTGKTHMARKLFYRLSREYPRLAWVEYGTGIRSSMTRSMEGAGANPEQWFDQFIRKLEEAERDTILFIDDAKEDAADDAVLSQITGMGITVLMTSRCPDISPYETWEMEPVSARACTELFYANYRKDTKKQYWKTVRGLADRLDCNVFAMLLLANVVGEPTNLPRIAECLKEGSLMDHIGQLLELAQLTEAQQHVLRCLSLTNSGEIPESLVDWFDFQKLDVKILIDSGWLVRNKETKCIVLHDLVREYYTQYPANLHTVDSFIKGVLGSSFNARTEQNQTAEFKRKVLDFQVRALEIMETNWESKTDLACAYNSVGIAFSEFGNHRKALEYKLKALVIREKMLPSDHPDLAISYNNVGKTYGDLGDHKKAHEYKLKALVIREKVLPSDHPDLATSYNNVGTSYGDLGDHKKALQYIMKGLAIREKVLPTNHLDLAVSYNNIGALYGDLGDHVKALKYTRRALAIREEVLPADHPDLAASYNNLGSIYGDVGDHTKALEYKLKDLGICKRVLPADHPDLATSYDNIGATYSEMGDYTKALEYTLKALTIRTKVLPVDHPVLALSYNNVGIVYSDLGNYSKALEYNLKDLAISEKILPVDHPDLATSYNNIGTTYSDLGNYSQALEYMLKALAIRERVLPSNHPDIAASCYNIAFVHSQTGRYEVALDWMRRALDIARRSLLMDHPNQQGYQERICYLEQKILESNTAK